MSDVARSGHAIRGYRLALAALLVAFAGLAGTAMLRNSTTFDEILFPAAGARGFHTGDFRLVVDHPPIMQYVYGFPVWLAGARYPAEEPEHWDYALRYPYAQAFYWGAGNSPERIAAGARTIAVLLGTLLVFATFALSRRTLGDGAALLAATLVAFLPDVLAHSGISYNDVPLALALFVAVHLVDRAARSPTPGAVAAASFASAIAVCVKFSGAIAGPILVVLVAIEALSGRWRDARWRRSIALGIPLYCAIVYATLVAVYRGDWSLAQFFQGLGYNLSHASHGNGGIPAVLLGNRSTTGWWYFFPVAFLLKTPAALHALSLIALTGAWLALRGRSARELLSHPSRAWAVAAILFLASVMATRLNIGVRHALPIMPFACVLVAQGLASAWRRSGVALRGVVALLVAWNVASVTVHYPYFLPYLSEYVAGRMAPYDTLVDSNTDWGQGLFALRDYMKARGLDTIYLSYFGSALPEGYGIRYVPMPSFFELPSHPLDPQHPPRYAAISATNLAGSYLDGDPFAGLRGRRPVAVVADDLWIFEVAPPAR